MTKPRNDVSATAPVTLLTPAEVGELFHVDPKTVTRWAKTGRLHALVTPGGHRRFVESEVLAVRENGSGLHLEVVADPELSSRIPSQPDATEISTQATAAAVLAAAETVAHAAEISRGMRDRDAQVAAHAAASQAARAAIAVQMRADLSAQHIAEAVSLVAEIVAAGAHPSSRAEAVETTERLAQVAHDATAAAKETALAATNLAEAATETAAEVAAVSAAATAMELELAEAAVALKSAARVAALRAATGTLDGGVPGDSLSDAEGAVVNGVSDPQSASVTLVNDSSA